MGTRLCQESGWKEKQQLEGFDPAVMCPCSLQPKQGPSPGRGPGQHRDFGVWAELTDTGWKKKSQGE